MRALLCLLLLLPLSVGPAQGETNDDALLYNALVRVENTTHLWAGEGYGERYNDFSQALVDAYGPYKRVLFSDPSTGGKTLLTIYDDYREVQKFWKAYLNDQVVLWRSMRFAEPTYIIGRDVWPERLEKRFPGVLDAIGERDYNGEMYISGKRALGYILKRIGNKLRVAEECPD